MKGKQKKIMEQTGKEGDVIIDKVPNKDKKGLIENMGEYVDFEEVDE